SAVSSAVIEVAPAAAKLPLVESTFTQVEVFKSDQLKAPEPELVSWNWPEMGVKGPPRTPEAVKLTAGETPRASRGPASTSIKAWPAGVPQPVHRSYPATA